VNTPAPADLADLLSRAEQAVAAQRAAYGTALDDDTATACAWNTWRTLADLLPVLHSLATAAPTARAETDTGRRLTIVREAA
jgi:hypothetical protein